jgi:hypothetical protein
MRAASRFTRRILTAALAAAAALAASCGPAGTVQQLVFVDVVSGYHDEGVVNGENKLVPEITFKLQNTGTEPLGTVQLNVHFRVDGADGNMDEVLTRATDSGGLAPQQSTATITVRSKVGYTSQQARADMLKNSQFRDVKVRVFGKSGSAQWSQIGEFPVERKLLTF